MFSIALVMLTFPFLATGSEIQQLPRIGDTAAPGTIQDFTISSDGRLAVISGVEGKIIRLDTLTGRKRTLVSRYPYSVYAMAVSPPSGIAAIGTLGEIVLISLDDEKHTQLKMRIGADVLVEGLAFSPDGRLLAASSLDLSYITIWNPATGSEVDRLVPCEGGSKSVVFSPDGRDLAASCGDNSVKIWNLDTSHEISDISIGSGAWVNRIEFSKDGRWVFAATGGTNTIEMFDAGSGARVLALKGHTQQVDSIALRTDGVLVSTSDDGTVRLWNADTGTPIRTLEIPDGLIAGDGSVVLAQVEEPGVLQLWNARTGEKIRTFHVWADSKHDRTARH